MAHNNLSGIVDTDVHARVGYNLRHVINEIINGNGPIIEPCRTSNIMGRELDIRQLMQTSCCRPLILT